MYNNWGLVKQIIHTMEYYIIIKNVIQSRRHNPHTLQTILQNYSNQKSGIGIKNSHMYQWQKTELQNKSTHLELINLWQGAKNIKCEKDSLFSK